MVVINQVQENCLVNPFFTGMKTKVWSPGNNSKVGWRSLCSTRSAERFDSMVFSDFSYLIRLNFWTVRTQSVIKAGSGGGGGWAIKWIGGHFFLISKGQVCKF